MMFGSKVREKQNAEQYTADVQKINSISKSSFTLLWDAVE